MSQRSHLGHPSEDDVHHVDALLDSLDSVIGPLQAQLHNHPGRKAEVSLKALLGYFLLNEMAGNDLTIRNVMYVAKALPAGVRARWGDRSPQPTYARLHHLFRRTCKLRCGGNVGGEISEMDSLMNELLQLQLDATGIDFGSAEAADGTVFRTTARSRFRTPNAKERRWNEENGRDRSSKIEHTVDPDAVMGHYPRKDGQQKFATGYEAHLFVPVPETNIQMPVVASAMTVQPNSTPFRVAMRDLAILRQERTKTLIFDAGYDRKGDESFQKLLSYGIHPIFDSNKKLRYGKTHSNGKIIIDGDEFCPQTPKKLRKLPDFAKNMSPKERANLEALYNERDRYRFERVAYSESTVRSMCPAQAGKVKCDGVPVSLNSERKDQPFVTAPDHRPKCCTQKTTSTPTHMLRRSRQGKYAYGTSQWLRMYGQRNRTESYNALFRHNIGHFEERKWCAVMGRIKMTFMLGIKLLATNVRSIANFLADTT